jgi:hypothetical protein
MKTGLSVRAVENCVARGLVAEPITSSDLSELRRIRRLRELGINMPGIEVILHMRHRIRAMQAELDLRQRSQGEPGGPRREVIWHRRLTWEPDRE